MDDGGVDWGWAGKSHRLWILAAARPCGGAAVVVDPNGTAFVGVWGTAAVDAAAAARARQHSAGRARGRAGRQPDERAGDAIAGVVGGGIAWGARLLYIHFLADDRNSKDAGRRSDNC